MMYWKLPFIDKKHRTFMPLCLSACLCSNQTYYEALGLKQDCTNKEIKEAYVKLCKQFHPDRKPGDNDLHKKFVFLNEAYSVLSKPGLRRVYDDNLRYGRNNHTFSSQYPKRTDETYMHRQEYQKQWHDETIWEMRDKSKDKFYEGQPYYGIKGLKRVSNFAIVGGCVLILFTGIIIHFMSYKYGVQLAKRMDDKDKRIAREYTESRAAVLATERELQIELFQQRLEAGNHSSRKD